MRFYGFEDSRGKNTYTMVQGFNLTRALINTELSGIFNSETLQDMSSIIDMYKVYFDGAPFNIDRSSGDWVPSDWRAKEIKSLIDKEARFMFSTPPDIQLKDLELDSLDNSRLNANEELLNEVLEKNGIDSKLVKAAKDYLIGKRVAIAINFNETKGIQISFIPSLEFVYETDPTDISIITKFIQFYTTTANDDKFQQRVYKKKWYLQDGICRVVEEMYDGNARLIETLVPDSATLFTYIPVGIVINEGLTGDPFGTSEVESLIGSESWYSKLSNKDLDSLRKGTDQITWARDIDPGTTKNLSRAPGAFWDLASDPAKDGVTGEVGTLDNPMSYSSALQSTLNRLKTSMYSSLDVPDTSNEALQGIITSGKTMQAIYWGLMVRCDEKMLEWIPALKNMAYTIIEGAKLYPNIARLYVDEPLVDGYTVIVENNYPILQDETEEKASDIMEVNAKVRSRKSYLIKWMRYTNDEAEAELEQILKEQQLLEGDNFSGMSEGSVEE